MAQQQPNSPDNLNINSLLQAAADCASALLSDDDFERGVNQALEILGTSVDADRLGIAEQHNDPTERTLGYIVARYEWRFADTTPQISDRELSRINCEEFREDHFKLQSGHHCGGLIENYPEPFRSGQKKLGVKSVYVIPIMINGQYWGLISLDFCRIARELSEAEITVLKTAATCIGSAIQRERDCEASRRHRTAKELAERNVLLEREQAAQERVKLLQAVATVANPLLRSPDYQTALPEVLRILGEAAKSDRCGLVQNVPDPVTGEAAVKLHTEWCREGVPISVESTPELETALLWSDFPQFHEKLAQGEICTFLVDELSEPARSIFQGQGNVSMTLVPIVVQGEFWGVFGFDYCQEARLFEETDTAVFAIAVDSIAAAIERERQDEALKASEKRFRELFEASNDGIHFLEFEPPIPVNLPIEEQVDRVYNSSQIIDVNPALERHFGLSRSEMIGKSITVAHSPDSAGHRSLMRRMIENGWQITNEESEDIDANGNKRYWLSHLFATIENGCVVRGWGLANNITPLKEAQQALLEAEREKARELKAINVKLQQALAELAESEKRFRELFEASNDAINFVEFEPPIPFNLPIEEQIDRIYSSYKFTDINPAGEIHCGLSRSEIVGKPLTVIHSPDSAGHRSLMRRMIENGWQITNAESEDIDADGNKRYWLSNLFTTIENGYAVRGWGVVNNITPLKEAQQALLEAEREKARELAAINVKLQQALAELAESEKRYRTLFELSNEGIYRFEIDSPIDTSLPIDEQLDLLYQHYRVTQVNNTFLEQFGFSSLSDVIGKGLNDFDPSGSANREGNRAILENGYQIRNLELEGLTADSQVRYFLSNIVCNTADGYVWGGWGMCTDITELKQAQQALLEAERQRVAQLEASNQVLSLRDRWLEATANAANQLLATPDLDAGINAALKMLGESLDCDRVDVMQHFEDDTEETLGYMQMLHEWDSKNTSSQFLHPELNRITWYEEFREWAMALQAGDFAGGVVEEFSEPFRSEQIELGCQSTYAAPIFVNEQFWGILGIDYCREARRLTPAEIAVFKTAASCVGSAIYRQQIQQQREEAEKTIILERERAAQEKAAELTKVNQVLSRSLGKLTDTADLDEFLGQVVLEITRQVGAVCGHIFSYDADNHTLNLRLSVRNGIIYQGAAEHDCELFHSPFPADISPGFAYLCQTREISLLSTNDDADPTLWWKDTIEWHRRMGHQEAAAVALMIDDKPLGMIGLAFIEKSALKPEELELIYALNNQASLAIQLTNLAEESQTLALIEERNRMAGEIHDTLGQSFTAIVLQLEAANRLLNIKTEQSALCLKHAQDLAHRGITQVQRSLWTLRNIDEYRDLTAALQHLVTVLNTGTSVQIELSTSGIQPSLSADLNHCLLRIAQEALTNALKHANANLIHLQLDYESDRVQLQIQDDGNGFAPELLKVSSGFGIKSMQQRAESLDAMLKITTNSGCGTTVTVNAPFLSS